MAMEKIVMRSGEGEFPQLRDSKGDIVNYAKNDLFQLGGNRPKPKTNYKGITEFRKPYIILAKENADKNKYTFHQLNHLMPEDARIFMASIEKACRSPKTEIEQSELNFGLKFEKAHKFNNNGFVLTESLAREPFEINIHDSLLGDLLRRQEKTLDSFRRQGYASWSIDVPIDHSFISGFSNASIHSGTIATHSVLGLPYLPGSGVKGAFRAFVEQYLGDNPIYDSSNGGSVLGELVENDKGEVESLKRSDLIFLDAFPKNKCLIKADILTNHYPAWYKSEGSISDRETSSAPGDWQTPMPVEFPSLQKCDGEAIEFGFNLLYKLNKSDRDIEQLKLKLAAIRRHFLFMVALGGFGAKTGSGYGVASTIAASEEGHHSYAQFKLPNT